jgi:hypothetical protein
MSHERDSLSSVNLALARSGYLVLATCIQTIVFAVFIISLNIVPQRLVGRWPFLVSEFLAIVVVCFGNMAIARDICWQLDLIDVLIPFVLGLLQCLAILLLCRVPHDALWWFVCYFAVANFIFLALLNARMKTPAAVALPLVKKRAALCVIHLTLVALAIVACYCEWQVKLVGILFMIEQLCVFAAIYYFDISVHSARPPGPPPQSQA